MTTLVPKYDQGATGAVNRPFNQKLAEQVSVLDFGAVGNGTTDDTAAIQAALNTGKNVYFPNGTYMVASSILASASNITISGTATIKPLSTYVAVGFDSVLKITGSNVNVSNLIFDGVLAVANAIDALLFTNGASNVNVTNCTFKNLTTGFAVGFNPTSSYSKVTSCYCEATKGGILFQGTNPTAHGNVLLNMTDCGIILNGPTCIDGVISGNSISNTTGIQYSGMISIEEAASQWTVTGNTLTGQGNGIQVVNVYISTDVTGGTISGNVINGGSGTTASIVCLLYVSPHYLNTVIANNLIYGAPNGVLASALLLVSNLLFKKKYFK